MKDEKIDVNEVLKLIDDILETKTEESQKEHKETDSNGGDEFSWNREDFLDVQIQEIELGEKQGLDISLYVDTNYNWRQMYEIRMGLLEGLDVSRYSSHAYSADEMHEIRLGMLYGIDVSSYESLVFSASDKYRMRLDILKGKYQEEKTVFDREVKDERHGMILRIEECAMKAYIALIPEYDRIITTANVLKFLKLWDVVFGIERSNIEKLLHETPKGEFVQVAEGREMVEGNDGYYDFFFNQTKPTPTIDEEGNVNYTEMLIADTVEEAQVLAVYHPAGMGVGGCSVTNISTPGTVGKNVPALHGVGFRFDKKTNTYYSNVRGFVTFDETTNILNVRKIYEIKGDANRYNTHLQYDGTVHVEGSVGSGVQINASGDIIVDGYAEGVFLNAGQNVVIRGGVNADGKGCIQAKGFVMARFYEAANIRAVGNVEGNYFLNCNVECDGKIMARGGKSRILGGKMEALAGIEASVITNYRRVGMSVIVGDYTRLQRQKNKLEECLKDYDAYEARLQEGKLGVLKNHDNNGIDKAEVYRKILRAIEQVKADRENVKTEIESIQRRINTSKHPYIRVPGELSKDVLVTMGTEKKRLQKPFRGVLQMSNWEKVW